ncbi:hypothetical protein Btru_066613 [Bulinus truncatus]|nr:hypothetical protein Btru_066613 [Bulinus truncatus]
MYVWWDMGEVAKTRCVWWDVGEVVKIRWLWEDGGLSKQGVCGKKLGEVVKTKCVCGGTFLNISGSFINSIKVPQFAINITNVLNNTYDIFTEACKEPNSNNTLCRTPNTSKSILSLFKGNTSMEYIYATVSLCSGDNCFTLEGNEQLKIYRDPVFNKTNFRLSMEKNTKVLRLKGKYIPEWLQNHECNISVGRFHCPVTKVDKLYIECDVSQIIDQQKQQNSGNQLSLKDAKTKELAASNTPANTQINLTVTVTIGNYEEIVGVVSLEKTESNGNTTPLYISLIGGVMAGLVFVFVILLIVTINIRQRRSKLRKRPFYLYGSKIDLQMQSLKEILTSIGDQVKNEDFDKLIIDLDKLTIGKPLGSGNFGCVYEGILQESRDQQLKKVAVKTLKDPKSHNIDLAAFIQEALIMKNFQHSNVLELVGLTEKEPGVPYVILPYMDNGDLLTYVRNTSVNLSLHDVIKFGADIASGMAYLSSLKFVHRDLAARNCMLDSFYTVKVADFGLCRDIYEKGYYSSDNKKLLPIRWMAVESIEHGSYSTKSDVWSFGIVLWELLTRGVTPYPGINGWDIINFLRQRRLARPHFCPPILYKFMTSCWSYKPELRPTFTSLAFDLYALIGYEQKGQSCPSPIGYNASNKDVPIFKVTAKDNYDSLNVVGDEGYVNEITQDPEHYYAVLESPGTISNTMITMPTCYTLVQVCTFPELNDHQAGVSESTDQSYVQVLDHYDPIKLNAS